jgi:PhnB protein
MGPGFSYSRRDPKSKFLSFHVSPWVGSIYVYIEDVDAVYGQAIRLGAKSIVPPEDKPYDERQAGFIDPGGNTWWMSTYKQMR